MELMREQQTFNPFNKANNFTLSKPSLEKRKHVLLIEDDKDFSELLGDAMSDVLGLSVDIASDPFEALEMMMVQHYDAIILDWNLPHLNGTQTLRRAEISFRFEPELPAHWNQGPMPVIVISAHSEEHIEFRDSPHFHVAGFVSKTQSLARVLLRIQEKLNNVFALVHSAS